MPAGPHLGEFLGGVVQIAHLCLDIRAVDHLAIQGAAALAVLRLQIGGDGVQFLRRLRGRGRGKNEAGAQHCQLAFHLGIEPFYPGIACRLTGVIDLLLRALGTLARGERVGVRRDVGRIDPGHLARIDGEIIEIGLRRRDEIGRSLRRQRVLRGGGLIGGQPVVLRHGGQVQTGGDEHAERDGSEQFHRVYPWAT